MEMNLLTIKISQNAILLYSSWEKGLIEKTNLNNFNEQQIKEIQYKINNRPRKSKFLFTKRNFLPILEK